MRCEGDDCSGGVGGSGGEGGDGGGVGVVRVGGVGVLCLPEGLVGIVEWAGLWVWVRFSGAWDCIDGKPTRWGLSYLIPPRNIVWCSASTCRSLGKGSHPISVCMGGYRFGMGKWAVCLVVGSRV